MIESGGPLSEVVRLHQAGAGLERVLEPDAEGRARIARSLDLAALDAFRARVRLEPGEGGWVLSGQVTAAGAQTCGITLDPLPFQIDQSFSVRLSEAAPEEDEVLVSLDDDAPDPIEDGQVDLGQYAVEQLSLCLDPFPRRPGAEFVQPPEPEEISPFAVLKALKDRDEG